MSLVRLLQTPSQPDQMIRRRVDPWMFDIMYKFHLRGMSEWPDWMRHEGTIYLFVFLPCCVCRSLARLLACLNVSCILLSCACWEFMIAASRWHPYFTSRQVHQCVRLASEDNIFITPPPHGCIMMQSKLTPRFFNVPTSSHFLRSFK